MAERSGARIAKRSFASNLLNFDFWREVSLRFAQPFLAKYKWPTYCTLISRRVKSHLFRITHFITLKASVGGSRWHLPSWLRACERSRLFGGYVRRVPRPDESELQHEIGHVRAKLRNQQPANELGTRRVSFSSFKKSRRNVAQNWNVHDPLSQVNFFISFATILFYLF